MISSRGFSVPPSATLSCPDMADSACHTSRRLLVEVAKLGAAIDLAFNRAQGKVAHRPAEIAIKYRLEISSTRVDCAAISREQSRMFTKICDIVLEEQPSPSATPFTGAAAMRGGGFPLSHGAELANTASPGACSNHSSPPASSHRRGCARRSCRHPTRPPGSWSGCRVSRPCRSASRGSRYRR